MSMILNNGHLGANIQFLRKRAGLSQEKLVAQMNLRGSNISRTGLSKIERGVGNIKEDDLRLIKSILKVDYRLFFEDE